MTYQKPPRPERPGWRDLPSHVRNGIADEVGGPLTPQRDLDGGYGPGVATVLAREDGALFFVKAIAASLTPRGPGIYRSEIEALRQFPNSLPTPRLRATYDDDDWVALVLDVIDGAQPNMADRDERALVIAAIRDLSERLTPSPIKAPRLSTIWDEDYDGFRALSDAGDDGVRMLRPFGSWPVENLETLAQLESKGGAATNGETLLHCDLRDDNILVTRERDVYFIDWPEACIGAAWFDLVVMVSSLALVAGHEVGLDLLSLCAADHDAVAAALAGVAGFFVHGSCLPPPPGLPTVRQFQADQGHAALDLLRAWVD